MRYRLIDADDPETIYGEFASRISAENEAERIERYARMHQRPVDLIVEVIQCS